MPRCRYCCRRAALPGDRGLCRPCLGNPRARRLYPGVPSNHAPPGETMADVERIIEQQMRCLPSWWWDHVQQQEQEERRDRDRYGD